MSMMNVQSTSDESLAENMEINFKSLSLGNGSSCSSDQFVPCLAQQDQSDELSPTKDDHDNDGVVLDNLVVEGRCEKDTGSTENMMSEDDSCNNEDPNMSAESADDLNNVQPAGVTTSIIPGQQQDDDDVIFDSNFGAPGLSVSREVLLRQMIEAGNNNLSFHLSHVNMEQRQLVLRSGVGVHASSHSRLHPSTAQGIPNMALNPNAAAYYPLRSSEFGSSQSSVLLRSSSDVFYVDNSGTPNYMVFVPSNHQVDYYSAGFQSSYLPWFVSPWNGLGGGWNVGFIPSAYLGTYSNPYFSDSLIVSHSGYHHRSLQLPHTSSQSVEASTERVPRLNSEFRQVVIHAHHMGHLLAQFHLPVIDAHHMELMQNQPLVIYSGYYPHLNIYGFSLFHRFISMGLEMNQMSYEDLLLLGEQIGSVKTGLSEETIKELLKRKHYECDISDSPSSSDAEMCCICRGEYVHGEEIGVLNCGHEFHTECIKSWLVIKNDCPMCKRTGLDA